MTEMSEKNKKSKKKVIQKEDKKSKIITDSKTQKTIDDYANQIISTDLYKYKPWIDVFPDYHVDINRLLKNELWKSFFGKSQIVDLTEKINKQLSKLLEKTQGKIIIYPYPKLLFHVFNLLNPKDIKVVIVGQDPYINSFTADDKTIPEAMGISFSIPTGVPVPPTLKNIYKNMLDYKHIKTIPTHGNLTSWVNQGVFMLNASLTVEAHFSKSHEKVWTKFTDYCIKYISKKCDHVIFVAWGKDAYLTLSNKIDLDKHKLIVSGHPSPLSRGGFKNPDKTSESFEAFKDVDHFKEINKFLKANDLTPIIWQI